MATSRWYEAAQVTVITPDHAGTLEAETIAVPWPDVPPGVPCGRSEPQCGSLSPGRTPVTCTRARGHSGPCVNQGTAAWISGVHIPGWEEPICYQRSPDGWYCTEPNDHGYLHIARKGDGSLCAVWDEVVRRSDDELAQALADLRALEVDQ